MPIALFWLQFPYSYIKKLIQNCELQIVLKNLKNLSTTIISDRFIDPIDLLTLKRVTEKFENPNLPFTVSVGINKFPWNYMCVPLNHNLIEGFLPFAMPTVIMESCLDHCQ